MNTSAIATIRTIASNAIDAHPELKADIIELAQMAVEEINEGESADNEIELMREGIKELLN